jgi:hypothetical protein
MSKSEHTQQWYKAQWQGQSVLDTYGFRKEPALHTVAPPSWHFINYSYHFMSAYRLGLTGKAVEWAVHKQKQHQAVLQWAMMAIKAVLLS